MVNTKYKNIVLRNYQKRCLSFIEKHGGNALLALDMGLGKTLTALAYCQTFNKVLIICPASVKYQWAIEIEKWYKKQKICILSGKTNKKLPATDKYYIINYDIISSWGKSLTKLSFDVLILDECHYLKNGASQRTKAVTKLAKQIPSKIGLSGTPMINRPKELFPILKIINNSLFPNFMKYGHKYCYRKNFFAPKGFDYNGAKNLKELNQILKQKVLIRRTKAEVLKELPDITKTIVPFKIDMEEYNKAKYETIAWLQDQGIKKTNVMAVNQIEYLKQISAHEKTKQVITWIEDFLKCNDKLVLFATHKDIINTIINQYAHIAKKIDGTTPAHMRQKIKTKFMNDKKIHILIGNIKAMGTGLDGLQHTCKDVGFIELPWTFAELDQAYSRLHRLGQKKVVNMYFFVAKGTIDRYILTLLNKKKTLVDTVINKKDKKNNEFFRQLLVTLEK